MQGTMVVLMALSGLGCHHKACDTGCAPVVPTCYASSSCYGGGCYGGYDLAPAVYAPSCYSTGGGCYGSSCYASSCYAASYASACYGGGCYGGHRKHGGLFRCHKRNACAPAPVCEIGCGAPIYGSYSTAIPGDTYGMPAYASGQGVYPTGQVYGAPYAPGKGMMMAPAPAAVPATPTPAPEPKPEPAPPEPAPKPSAF